MFYVDGVQFSLRGNLLGEYVDATAAMPP
jgi:hypothetical protein